MGSPWSAACRCIAGNLPPWHAVVTIASSSAWIAGSRLADNSWMGSRGRVLVHAAPRAAAPHASIPGSWGVGSRTSSSGCSTTKQTTTGANPGNNAWQAPGVAWRRAHAVRWLGLRLLLLLSVTSRRRTGPMMRCSACPAGSVSNPLQPSLARSSRRLAHPGRTGLCHAPAGGAEARRGIGPSRDRSGFDAKAAAPPGQFLVDSPSQPCRHVGGHFAGRGADGGFAVIEVVE